MPGAINSSLPNLPVLHDPSYGIPTPGAINSSLPNLPVLQDPSYGIPTDVTFQIRWCDDEAEIDCIVGEVSGHKVVLGAGSQVFRDMFFGSLKETNDIITVKQTSPEAFKKMFDFIYNKEIIWADDVTVTDLFDVVNLAEKYSMDKLMDVLKTQMMHVPLTSDNLIETANIAIKFGQLFPNVSSTLLHTCAKFLRRNWSTPADQLKFSLNQYKAGHGDTALQLLALIEDLPATCETCGEEKTNCRDGQTVNSVDKLMAGTKLRKNTGYFGDCENETVFIVVSVDKMNNTVQLVKSKSKEIKTYPIIYKKLTINNDGS